MPFSIDPGRADRIEGVAYIWNTNTAGYTDLLADEEQCAIDAPLMKDLGVNVISVYAVDATKDHDKCMQIFLDNDIYVIANLEGTWAMVGEADGTWESDADLTGRAIIPGVLSTSRNIRLSLTRSRGMRIPWG